MSRSHKRSRYVDMALDYARAVQSGEQPACRYVRIACETFLQDYARAVASDGPWGFDAALAHDAMAFAEALPNIKGPSAGKTTRFDALADAAVHGGVRLH